LLHDSQTYSEFWEPGCEFAGSTGGLYAMGLTNKWFGGIGGNKLTQQQYLLENLLHMQIHFQLL